MDPRHKSRTILEGPDRAPARSYFKAVGFTDEDLARPIVGVAHCWIEVTPCNWNHQKLAEKVKEGIRAAGGTPIEYNTVSVTDGIAMGTEGMKGSLVSREVVADSIELVARGHLFDAVVAISGCDKTIPGTVMALARLNLPGIMLYGGSIMPGSYGGRKLTVQDVFEAVGAYNAGRISAARAERDREPCLSGSRGVRGPVHGEHDGHDVRADGHLPDGVQRRAGGRPAEGGGRVRDRPARHGAPPKRRGCRARS